MSNEASTHQPNLTGPRLVLLVPRAHVKAVKSALELRKSYDRRHGIYPEVRDGVSHEQNGDREGQRMCLSTTIAHIVDEEDPDLRSKKRALFAELQLEHLLEAITLSTQNPFNTDKIAATEHNPLRKALREALEALPPDTLASLTHPHLTVNDLVSTFPESYSIYKPLLLLPSHSLNHTWSTIISLKSPSFNPVWHHIATTLQCTHIALNSPIPASNTPTSAHGTDTTNLLRSPVYLHLIHGSFGPAPTPQTLRQPSPNDLANTLWVHTTQNGIVQTWAPLYTMFSRGNVKEKARILHLPSVTSLADTAQGATAVDMYAGIGYFSFSYRKAGMRRVLGWELNPWSVEGLRRGAALNGWTCRVFTPGDVPIQEATEREWNVWRQSVGEGGEDFWIFQMSNDTASRIIRCLRDCVPPVRHVNLGLLPVSRLSWPAAVGALDGELRGWIHAHENVGVVELDERKVEVESALSLLHAQSVTAAGGRVGIVQVEHVERVKLYAPGVVHAVFDVHIKSNHVL